jgi:hypothetical protein
MTPEDQRRSDPANLPSARVRPDVGKTAAEGERAGQAANQQFNREFDATRDKPLPKYTP